MKKAACILSGMFLLIFSLFGVLYSFRAGAAQWIYFRSKYGSEGESLETITDNCRKAYILYPHNYYFSILVSERNYYERSPEGGSEQNVRISSAKRWCDLGLDQNFYKSQLRLMKTRLLARDSLEAAIAFWEDYVEWQFWEPYNHAVLAEMCVENGDFSKASKSIQWVKGSKYYKESVRKFNEAWDEEMKLPDLKQILD